MSRLIASLAFPFLLVFVSACEQPANRSDDGGGSVATPAGDSSTPGSVAGGSAGDDHAEGGHGVAGEGGQALLPIMQRLGGEMTTLTYALMTDEYETVERSAAAIAEHAPISAEELERIHTVLGPDMARFEAVDESVHVASVRLLEAARARQPGQVIERLGEVQRGCLSCHTQFRERLLTNPGVEQAAP